MFKNVLTLAALLCVLTGASGHADDVLFGKQIADPYRWLEISTSTQTQAWLHHEELDSQDYFSHLTSSNSWHRRLQALAPSEDLPLLMPLAGTDGRIFDSRQLGIHPSPHFCIPSPDGHFAAYALSERHNDAGELHVRDLRNKHENSRDIIPWEQYGDLAWSSDSHGFYYLSVSTGLPDADRVAEAVVRYHRLGTVLSEDALIFPATHNASRYLIPQTSADGRWLFISIAEGFSGTTLYARDLASSTTTFGQVFSSTQATASVQAWGDQLFLLTNSQAPHYAIWTTHSISSPWKMLIPESSEAVIDSFHLAGHHLVLTRVRNAYSELRVVPWDGKNGVSLPLPAAGTIEDLEGLPDRDDFYFRFESFFIPPKIMKGSVRSGQVSVVAPKVAGFNAKRQNILEQKQFTSKDGTWVPLWLLHAPQGSMQKPHPTILAVYGGFGVSMTPRYQAGLEAWLEYGGVVAIPLLRGGGEFGESWHQAGSGLHKQQTFDDAIAAAEFLIAQKYTDAAHLEIQGASNGGLTAAAVITQRPDLFCAAIIKNPLTDMIRYPLFGEGPAWISEYGSPQNGHEFEILLSYSPYHHLRAGLAYPATLILSAEMDDRVAPMHARKFTAALQNTAPPRPILFRVIKDAGHEGSGSATATISEWTDRLTFLENELGH